MGNPYGEWSSGGFIPKESSGSGKILLKSTTKKVTVFLGEVNIDDLKQGHNIYSVLIMTLLE